MTDHDPKERRALAILEALADLECRGSLRISGGYESDPGVDIDYGCVFCHVEEDSNGAIKHSGPYDLGPDEPPYVGCPWVAARKLLGVP